MGIVLLLNMRVVVLRSWPSSGHFDASVAVSVIAFQVPVDKLVAIVRVKAFDGKRQRLLHALPVELFARPRHGSR